MLALRTYYWLKPLLPAGTRLALRRWRAGRRRQSFAAEWPINPAAATPPPNWPGWPNGKKFALVLTHDVEGQRGLDRTRALAETELARGFRSNFNFVPAGEYRVSAELRQFLASNGFEIGVHDLKHDGKLYWSRSSFRRHAKQINAHLADWNAVGFRSGFMLRNLDWLHDLNIQYDSSTFDTDPFEPQPDGTHTIFPFWVPRPTDCASDSTIQQFNDSTQVQPHSTIQPFNRSTPASRGYIELPYTLAQDFTMFLVLQEKSIDIWKRKLDWLAAHGGMAMIDVHPDYVDPTGSGEAGQSYPLRYYTEFLDYVQQKYSGQYWLALPREVAAYAKQHLVKCSSSEKETNRGISAFQSFSVSASPPANGSSPHGARLAETHDFSISDPQPITVSHAGTRKKIWIDLDNTPHVPFFEPIVDELRKRGFDVVLTARDAFQVCDLADQKGIAYQKVGRHYGKNRLAKVTGLFYRALQLAPFAMREKPDIALSHGARSQIIISNLLGIPTVLMADYEFAQYPPMMKPKWEMVPEVIPDASLCCSKERIRKYPGIKEDVYVDRMRLDPEFLHKLGISGDSMVITVRPPATEAHYHNPEAEALFTRFMDRACGRDDVRVVLLPRNKRQGETIMAEAPQWFENARTVIPKGAVDGLNLLWYSDLVVSGGGTMNREAAALGVPVYSIFRGKTGAIDRHLQEEGRLVMITTAAEVDQNIKLERRAKNHSLNGAPRKALSTVVDHIEQITATYH